MVDSLLDIWCMLVEDRRTGVRQYFLIWKSRMGLLTLRCRCLHVTQPVYGNGILGGSMESLILRHMQC